MLLLGLHSFGGMLHLLTRVHVGGVEQEESGNISCRFVPNDRTALAFLTLRADEFMFCLNTSADLFEMKELDIDILNGRIAQFVSSKIEYPDRFSDVFYTLLQ